MKPYAQEAENLRLLFIAGIASVDDVVAWVDRTISTLPEYDDDLVKISLGAKVPWDELDGRLRLVSEGADHVEAVRNLLGRMHHTLLSDRSRSRDFARTVWNVYGEFMFELPREFGFMNLFEVIDTENNCCTSFADDLIAETAPFDTATPVPTPPLPTSRPSQSESSQKSGHDYARDIVVPIPWEVVRVQEMKDYEKQVARTLLGAAGLEALFDVLASAVDKEYEYTGHGYFLTIRHLGLPADRRVLDTPMISGRAKGVEEVGFVAFLENHEFTLECFSYGDGIPEDFRDRNVEIQVGK